MPTRVLSSPRFLIQKWNIHKGWKHKRHQKDNPRVNVKIVNLLGGLKINWYLWNVKQKEIITYNQINKINS